MEIIKLMDQTLKNHPNFKDEYFKPIVSRPTSLCSRKYYSDEPHFHFWYGVHYRSEKLEKLINQSDNTFDAVKDSTYQFLNIWYGKTHVVANVAIDFNSKGDVTKLFPFRDKEYKEKNFPLPHVITNDLKGKKLQEIVEYVVPTFLNVNT